MMANWGHASSPFKRGAVEAILLAPMCHGSNSAQAQWLVEMNMMIK